MAAPYTLNTPQRVPTGIQLSWTWPTVGTNDPEYYIYLQRSTTKSNWPLMPNWVAFNVDHHVPAVEVGWETVKTWFIPENGPRPSSYLDVFTPTDGTYYYRLIAYVTPEGVEQFKEYDWSTVSIQVASLTPGVTMWAKTLYSDGRSKHVKVLATATDTLGNVAVAGYYLGTVDFGGQLLTNLYANGIQYFVAKYTPTGSLIWVNGSTNGTGISVPSAIKMDLAGNVYTTGYFTVTMVIEGHTLTVTGYEDIFAFKHAAANGALSWYKQFGGVRSDYGRALVLDSSENPVIIGNFSDSVTFGGTTLTGGGGFDIFITKLSKTDGSVTFAKGYGYTGDEVVYGATTDNSGNIYITGQMVGACRFATSGTVYTAVGAGDIFVVRYNSLGDFGSGSWVKQFGQTAYAYGVGIAVDNTASPAQLLVTGSYQDAINFGGGLRTSPAGSKAYILKLTIAGDYVWDVGYGGASGGADSGKSIAVDANRNIVMVGTMVSTWAFGPLAIGGGSQLIIGNTPDLLTIKLTPAADVIWVNRYGDTGFADDASSVCITPNANIYVGGFFTGDINMGNAGSFSSQNFATQAGLFFKFQN